jgi:molecular chaperone GrpE
MSKKNKRKQNVMTEENKNPEVETQAAEAEMNEPEAPEAEPKAETDPAYEEMTLTAEEVKALKEKLDKLQEDKEDAIRQAQRLQAEFENYRKRNASISAESRDDGVRDAVKQMLPVLDNLERALQSAPEDPFAQGVRNIAKQFTDALAKVGAEEITAEGEFDPAVHEAVMKDSVEGVKSGHITGVLQKGYKVKGKIVRYAMVKVNE